MLAFAARELDLHKAFTVVSVLRLGFYVGDASIAQRLLAAALLAPVVLSLCGLLRRAMPVLACARRQDAAAITSVTFVAVLVTAKIFDRSINVLGEDFAVQIPPYLQSAVLALEEVLEMCLPCLACLACLQARDAAAGMPEYR
jgi:hypothetical protein